MAEAFNPYHRWLGIPPTEQPANHYRLLGLVLFESDPDVIESAADRQMAHVRTFQAGRYSEQSQTVLNELAAAKTCLLKPAQKAAYDQELRAKLDAAKPAPTSSVPTAVPGVAVPIIPAANTIPLAPQPNIAPQLPERHMPQIVAEPRSSTAPASRTARKSKGSNTTLVVGVGVALLLIVGVVGWQLNRQSPQELAAKPDSTSTPTSRTTEPKTKSPAKKSVVTPAEVKPAAIPPSVPEPPKAVASVPAKTVPVTPPAVATSLPAKAPDTQTPTTAPPALGANIVLTPGPNAVVPREIKYPKTGGMAPIFTPDSTLLLSANSNRLDVWNLVEKKQVGSITPVDQQFAVSPDGKKLAVEERAPGGGTRAEFIKIYELPSLKQLHQLPRPPDEPSKIPFFRVCGFDSTSKKLFTRNDVDLQVWDVQTGEMLRRIQGEKPPMANPSVYALNGRLINIPFFSGNCVLDTETEALTKIDVSMQELQAALGYLPQSTAVWSWSFTADGKRMFATEQVNSVLLEWSFPAAKLRNVLAVKDLLFAKVSPDNTRLLVEMKTNRTKLYVLDRASLEVITTLPTSPGNLSYYAISPDNRWVILRGSNEARLYDFGPQLTAKPGPTPQPVAPPTKVASIPAKQPNIPTPPVTSATATLTPAPNAIVPREIKLPQPGGASPIFTPDGAFLLYGTGTRVDIWNLAEEKPIASIDSTFPSFVVSPDGKKVAIEMQPKGKNRELSIAIFELATQKELRQLSRPADQFTNYPWFRVVGFDSASNKLFTRTNVDMQVWDVNSGELLRRIQDKRPPSNNATTYSLNGRYLYIDYPLARNVIDTQTDSLIPIQFLGQQLETLVTNRPLNWSLATWSFSADGKSVFCTETKNGLFLEWSLPEAKLVSCVTIPDLAAARVSPDGRRILAELKSARNALHVLDRASLQVIATLQTPEDRFVYISMSPDSRWLVLSGKNESNLYDFGPQGGAKKSPPGPSSNVQP